MCTICPAFLILTFDPIIINVEEYILRSSYLYNPFCPPSSSSIWGSLCTLFSNIFKLRGQFNYSPDLAPSGFHLFDPLKQVLGGKIFRTDDKLNFMCNKGWKIIQNLFLNGTQWKCPSDGEVA
jgi:hypothetical protein